MRLDLFSKGDSVLLLGEGNFSFAVCLHKHQLPVQIVATCFENKLEFEDQLENIEYLKSNKVPVFLNVDATKLHENDKFSGVKYSKIVFNFPHIGGKMKIHLNRDLLRKVFESCSQIIEENGVMIVSLCRGQGGTPADKPQRRWDDSWQITEMSAFGNFVLIDVEPFVCENFTEYRCVGYRGQDVKFHLEGALVHIFAKRESPYPCMNEDEVVRRLDWVSLKQNSNIFVPFIYGELYKNNPLLRPDSCISWLKRFVVENLDKTLRILTDDEVPVYIKEGTGGVSCLVGSELCRLRFSPLDIYQSILDKHVNEFVLFPGMYFNPLTSDFVEVSPVCVQFLIVGNDLSTKIHSLLNNLIELFQDGNVKLEKVFCEKKNVNNSGINLVTEYEYVNVVDKNRISAAQLYVMRSNVEFCVLNAQLICQYLFRIRWRDVWADKSKVVINDKPIFKPGLLYPSTYKFDITLRYYETYTREKLCEILWLVAGLLIEEVEIISEYTSSEGWSSTCYRITYRSLDKPLYKNRVVEIHSKIVGRALELGLNVTIS